jgi:hypothetical protein
MIRAVISLTKVIVPLKKSLISFEIIARKHTTSLLLIKNGRRNTPLESNKSSGW